MKKSILGTLICVMLICVMVASLSFSAFAVTDANVKDESYYMSYVSANSWAATGGRYKTNNSRVYVAPEKSPTGYTEAQTRCYVGGVTTNSTTAKAGYALLKDGKKYAISNTVFQSGDYTTNKGVWTWLRLTPNSGAGTLSGVWSPDWTGNTQGGEVLLV